jgi:tetratricopeptide (TPR) repeat protein
MALVDAHLSYVHESVSGNNDVETKKEWDDTKTDFESEFNISVDQHMKHISKVETLMSEINNKIIGKNYLKWLRNSSSFLTLLFLSCALIFSLQKGYKETMLEEIKADIRRLKDSTKIRDDLLSKNTADAWRNKGHILYDHGNYDESIKAYNKAIEIDPRDSLAWMSKGDNFKRQGKYDNAILAYDKAIKINPNSALVWSKKGAALMIKGKLDDAIKAYDKSIEIDPSAIAWDNRGWALSYLGKYDEAIQSFIKAIEIDPTNASAWYNRGTALRAVHRKAEADIAFAKAKTLGYS